MDVEYEKINEISEVELKKQKEENSKLKIQNKVLENENNYLRNVIKSKGPRSLINHSTNCYLNSSLQALAASTQLYEDLCVLLNHSKLPIASLLHSLIQLLNTSEEDSRNYAKASDISNNKILTKWNRSGQQDCHELISFIINEFYKEIKVAKNLTNNESLKLPMPLKIMFQNTLECHNCESTVKCPKQVDVAIHVTLPKSAFLDKIIPYTTCYIEDILDATLSNQEIEGFSCSNCQLENYMFKSVKLLAPLPQTLCLHLQRSGSISRGNILGLQKLRTKVIFGKTISVNFFVPMYKLNSRESYMKEEKLYKLVSVIEHTGFLNKGHYRCFRLWKEQWYSTDDAEVVRYDWEYVMKKQPYILIYDQI